MKKIKKLLFVFVALFTFSAVSYAVEVSLGGSVGLGVPFLRGKDAKDFTSVLENLSKYDSPSRISYTPRLDLMIEVLPFLAIETGVGFELTSISYGNSPLFFGSDNSSASFGKIQMSVPVMLRGQYEYKIGVTYAAVGVKLGFPLGDSYGYIGNFDQIKSSDFAMDVSFAVGQEFRLGDANYLGIRIGYDMNVIQNFDIKEFQDAGLGEYTSHFMDDVDFALTYRYAFGSKWKK